MIKTFCCGDIHGDYDRFVLLLQKSNLIDEQNNWIGGKNILVLTGDLTDRGEQGISVIKLVMALEKQAQSIGGNVVSILGNHDALIVARALQLRGESVNRDCALLFEYNGGIFQEAHELSEDDKMLKWMQERPLIYRHGYNLFQHADTTAYYEMFGDTLDEINKNAYRLMSIGEEAYEIFCEMTDRRYWDKQFGRKEPEIIERIEMYMSKHNVKRIIHGHTRFVGNEAQIYYDGKIINVDGSLSSGYRQSPDRGFIMEVPDVNSN
jgi:UDP-2,3-diacylglucosamine pyrophosphatase LpxH